MEKFIKQAARVLAPDSLPLDEEDSFRRFTMKEFFESEEIKAIIQPGDIVLTKTPSNVHGLMRRIIGAEYDHAAVFLTKTQALQISPPRFRIISANQFLMLKLNPFVVRPKFSNDAERDKFIEIMKNAQDLQYDYKTMFRLIGSKFASRFYQQSKTTPDGEDQNAHLDKRNICSAYIAYALAQCSKPFVECIERHYETLDIAQTGYLTPDDLCRLATADGGKYLKILYGGTGSTAKAKASESEKTAQKQSSHENGSEKRSLLTTTLELADAPLRLLQKHSEITKSLKRRQQQFKDEVRIVLENSNAENPSTMGYIASIVNQLLNIADKNSIFTQGFFKAVRLYSHSADIYVQLFRFGLFLFRLKNLLRDKNALKNRKREIIKCFVEVLISFNALVTYYRMEGAVKRVLTPRL